MSEILDVDALAVLDAELGDRDVTIELVRNFLQNGPVLISSLTTALATGDGATASRAAHTLKSTSATFGAARLSVLARDVERRAATDVEDAAELAAAVESEFAAARDALLAWCER